MVDTTFTSQTICNISDRGACSDGEAACWMSNSAGCQLINPFVPAHLGFHMNRSCDEVMSGPYLGYLFIETDICQHVAPVLDEFGSCNQIDQKFTLDNGANTTALYLHVLSVANGQTVIVKTPLTANLAIIYGTLISDTNSSITISGNTSLASYGGLIIDGSFSSGMIFAGANSTLALHTGGSLSSENLDLRGNLVIVDLSSSFHANSLRIHDGTELIIRISDDDIGGRLQFSYIFNSDQVSGTFSIIRVNVSECIECTKRCLNASNVTSTHSASYLQVTFTLNEMCLPGDRNAVDDEESLSLANLIAIVLAPVIIVAAIISCSVYYVKRKRATKVKFAELERKATDKSISSTPYIAKPDTKVVDIL